MTNEILLGISGACLVVLGSISLRMIRTTGLEEVDEFVPSARPKRGSGLESLLDSLGHRLLGITMRIYGQERLRRLEALIREAGRPDGLTLTVYVRRQGAFVFIGLVIVAFFALVGQALIGFAVLFLLASWMPIWLRTASRQRSVRIERELPDFLDVLGVTVSAGLGFRQAVERVCEVSHGALSDEMTTVLREMSLGVSRRQAFLSLRQRVRSSAIASFVTAMLQAEELGVPLADALTNISQDARRQRAEQVRQEMAKIQPKSSMVITATILPGAIVLIAASVILGNGGFSDIF
ncbi:MAG: type II secretion system F family protein [Micrococcales bacterium]|nr:type II secretion system F family protein [Micrococcales bacterium]MCL2667279.1 type II secretion system F family protein [Micrococcales bacterium]